MDSLGALGLTVPTTALPHRIDGLFSIDHVAVPTRTTVMSQERVVAALADRRLSDHDAYLVTLA